MRLRCGQESIACIAVCFALWAASHAQAQSWPARPIKFIVSQAAGGTPDITCRLITDKVSRALGQQIVVENRPGGGNIVGAQAAARSAPDGYTFFFATSAALVTNPYTFKSLPYDPAQALQDVETGKRLREIGLFTQSVYAARRHARGGAAYIQSQLEHWGRIVREIGMEPE
jgi:Tripartite tricarboxylate transporter family receptor